MDKVINKSKRKGLIKYKREYTREGDLRSIVGMHIYDILEIDTKYNIYEECYNGQGCWF